MLRLKGLVLVIGHGRMVKTLPDAALHISDWFRRTKLVIPGEKRAT